MATRTSLRTDLSFRLGDIGYAIWPQSELGWYLDAGIKSLYPSYFQLQTATTVGQTGPMQPMPVGCRNLYMVGVKNPTSPRVRRIRGWSEGDAVCFIPKTTIDGHIIVWSWTSGWELPASDTDILNIPSDAHESVILHAKAEALSRLLNNRVALEKYFAMQVRQGVTEDDIMLSIDAVNSQRRLLLERVTPLPEQMR